MRLVPLDPSLVRGLNFDYMNQVLAWQTLQDVLSTLRPMVAASAPYVTRLAAQGQATAAAACLWLASRASSLASASGEHHAGIDAQHVSSTPGATGEEVRAEQETGCGLCGASPISSPHVAQCAHAFCYVCLRSAQALARAAPPSCPRCSATLVGCERLRQG